MTAVTNNNATANTDADREAQYRRRCYYIRLLTVVGMNLCLWLTTYLMSPPLAHTPVVPSAAVPDESVDFVVKTGSEEKTFQYADGYRPIFRVATDREAGSLSINTAKDSFYFTALIASAFFVLTVAIRFGSRLVGMAEHEEPMARTALLIPDPNILSSATTDTNSDYFELSETKSQEPTMSETKSQELSTFLELGKSFLSPEFLKEMLEEETPSLAVKSPPSSIATCLLSPADSHVIPSPPDSLLGEDVVKPPGLVEQPVAEEPKVVEPKPACDVRNWRFSDKAPSLSNNRTLSAFHNLNASRKVPHHFYPDPQTLAKQNNNASRARRVVDGANRPAK